MKIRSKKGGAYLASGSDTCVVKPAVSCRAGTHAPSGTVSRLFVTDVSTEELAIHQELKTHYSKYVDRGDDQAIDSISIESCPATQLKNEDFVGMNPQNNNHKSCMDIKAVGLTGYKKRNGVEYPPNPALVTNIVTPEVTYPTLMQAVQTIENGGCVPPPVSAFRNIVAFLTDNYLHGEKLIVHADLHFANTFYNVAHPTGPMVYMHDFGRGMLISRRTYTRITNTHVTGYYMRLDYNTPHRFLQFSVPFMFLWNNVKLFREPTVHTHNERINEIRTYFHGRGNVQHYVFPGRPLPPPVNYNTPYFNELFDCLKSTDDATPFTNLFEDETAANSALFPRVKEFIERCLVYADFFSICNWACVSMMTTPERLKILFDTAYGVRDIMRVDTLYKMLTTVVDYTHSLAVSTPSFSPVPQTLPAIVSTSSSSYQPFESFGKGRRTRKRRRSQKTKFKTRQSRRYVAARGHAVRSL
jgi:hypothetical protein